MASRKIQDLKPVVQVLAQQVLLLAGQRGFDLLIYCTLRSFDEQARLYRKGRTLQQIIQKSNELHTHYKRPDLARLLIDIGPQPGEDIVTWAGPGQSLHNYGFAFDACPLRDGKPVWGAALPEDLELWMSYGAIGKDAGMEWAGNWPKSKREFPHMQEPDANWRELIQDYP